MEQAVIWIGSILAGFAALTVLFGAPQELSLTLGIVAVIAVATGSTL